MAQKNPFSPNAAAIGPVDPYPEAGMAINGSRNRRRKKWMTMCSWFWVFFFLVSLNEEVEGDGVSLIMGLLCKDGGW